MCSVGRGADGFDCERLLRIRAGLSYADLLVQWYIVVAFCRHHLLCVAVPDLCHFETFGSTIFSKTAPSGMISSVFVCCVLLHLI